MISGLSPIIKERAISRDFAEILDKPILCEEISVYYEKIRQYLPILLCDMINSENHAIAGTLVLGAKNLTERLDLFSIQHQHNRKTGQSKKP